MPSRQRVRPDDQYGPQSRRKHPAKPDEKKTVSVREPDPARQFTPQYDQLMPEGCVFGGETRLRPQRRRYDGQQQVDQRDHHRRR